MNVDEGAVRGPRWGRGVVQFTYLGADWHPSLSPLSPLGTQIFSTQNFLSANNTTPHNKNTPPVTDEVLIKSERSDDFRSQI